MTKAQFYAALERNGFKRPVLMWCESKEGPAISYGMLFTSKGKLLRRETVAYLIRRRNEEISRDEATRKARALAEARTKPKPECTTLFQALRGDCSYQGDGGRSRDSGRSAPSRTSDKPSPPDREPPSKPNPPDKEPNPCASIGRPGDIVACGGPEKPDRDPCGASLFRPGDVLACGREGKGKEKA